MGGETFFLGFRFFSPVRSPPSSPVPIGSFPIDGFPGSPFFFFFSYFFFFLSLFVEEMRRYDDGLAPVSLGRLV